MALAKLPKLYVMVKSLQNESKNAYFLIFMNEISHFDAQMHSQPHKHLKYSYHSVMNLFGSLQTITYRRLPNWQSI